MARLKYVITETHADWEENLYHAVVPITGGYVETDDPLTIEALLYRGFEVVDAVKAKPARKRKDDGDGAPAA